ncbi:hypothetical protein SAMN05216486_10362 [bacterium JGI 053]|nr:hypothetical protein SAMN05216486_10362 [bacterium JGI 053]
MRTSIWLTACVLLGGVAACSDAHSPVETTPQVRTYSRSELLQKIRDAGRISIEAVSSSEAEIAGHYGHSLPLGDDDFLLVIESVQASNPDFGHLSEADLERISRDFAGLERQEIIANLESIRDLYVAKMRSEVLSTAIEDARLGLRGNRIAVPGSPRWNYSPNSSELTLLATHPQLAIGTKSAANDAQQWAGEYGVSNDGYQGNALQHSAWNVLIAKNTSGWFTTVDDALDWAKKFTDAHEYGAPLPSEARHRSMDLHNNNEGRSVFRANATRTYSKIWGWQIKSSDVGIFKSLLWTRTDGAVKFTTDSQLKSLSGSLVFFLEPTRVGVHRLYNPGIPDHLYTTTIGEGTKSGWRTEANNYFYLTAGTGSSLQPLYRCYVSGRHYLSLDAKCESGGGREAELGRIARVQMSNTRPLYRLTHPSTKDRIETWDPSERDRAYTAGYRNQVVLGYIWTTAK